MGLPVQGTDAEMLQLLAEYEQAITAHTENQLTITRLSLLNPVDKSTEIALELSARELEKTALRVISLSARITEAMAIRWSGYYHSL